MRHYEIVLLIHPDQSEQVPAMLERYKGMITAGGGKVHRVEDWGRRQLAYHDPQARQGALPVHQHRVPTSDVMTELEHALPLQRRRAAPPDRGQEEGRDRPVVDDEDRRARRSPQGASRQECHGLNDAAARARRRDEPAGPERPYRRAQAPCATPPPDLPALDLSLEHESRGHAKQGSQRKVKVEIKAVAFGADGARRSRRQALGSSCTVRRLPGAQRNGRASSSISRVISVNDPSDHFERGHTCPRHVVKVSSTRTSKPKRNTQSLLFKRKRFCRFTVAGVEEIDYKDIDTLRDFVSENGKIIAGAPDRHARVYQRQLTTASSARASWRCCRTPTSTALRSDAMQVILLEKVANLGNLGDVVKVKDGYARNFLIPPGPARRATEAAIKEFEAKRAELEKAAADKLAAAQALGEKLTGTHRQASRRRPASTAACSARSPTPTSPKR